MRVEPWAPNRHEQIARLNSSGIDRHPAGRRIGITRSQPPAGCLGDVAGAHRDFTGLPARFS
jgi:hypothetical protein